MRVEAGGDAKWKVLLNGVDVSDRCYMADDESGVVGLYLQDGRGQFYKDGYGPAEELVSGRVEIFPVQR